MLRWAPSPSPRQADKLRRVPAGVPVYAKPRSEVGAGLLGPSPTPPPSAAGPNPGPGLTMSPNQSSASPCIFPTVWRPPARPNPRQGSHSQGSPRRLGLGPHLPILDPQTEPEILGRDTEFQSQAARLSSPPAQSLSPLQFSSARQKRPVRGMGTPGPKPAGGAPGTPSLGEASVHRSGSDTPESALGCTWGFENTRRPWAMCRLRVGRAPCTPLLFPDRSESPGRSVRVRSVASALGRRS